MSDEILRRFARDQWVRMHGTPRVTVLAGAEHARQMWRQWLAVGELQGELFEGRVDDAVRDATARAIAEPRVPIALLAAPGELAAWRSGRRDRLAAMVEEGLVEIVEAAATVRAEAKQAAAPAMFDARSAAEAQMFEALEATPATAGRFELNGYLSVHFGGGAAEVDLLARRDGIAIEIDGYHHFTDLDAYRRDRKKDLLLQLQGLIVIRLHAQDVMRDPRPGVTAVCQVLAYRMERRP
jgi:very-short-patch-repair endonuclease